MRAGLVLEATNSLFANKSLSCQVLGGRVGGKGLFADSLSNSKCWRQGWIWQLMLAYIYIYTYMYIYTYIYSHG